MGAAKDLRKSQAPEAKAQPDQHASDSPGDHDTSHDLFLMSSHKKTEEGEGPWLISYADMMTLLMGFFALIASFSKVDNTEFEKVKKEAVKYFGGEYKEPYGDLADTIRKIVQQNNLQDQVRVDHEIDGVHLTFRGTMLFDSGRFEVKEEAKEMMSQIVNVIRDKARDHHIEVEGHTDNVPIHHDVIASNWELSALRAARVARLFENVGFSKQQLAIQGWGEIKPIAPNTDSQGVEIPANQAKNRRVLIRIYKTPDDVSSTKETAKASPSAVSNVIPLDAIEGAKTQPQIPPPPNTIQLESIHGNRGTR